MAAAGIVQVNFMLLGKNRDFHTKVMAVFGIWAVVGFLFQKMLNQERLANLARFAWAAADAIQLTVILYLAPAPIGPLLIGYPLLVASSGLWFRVTLVWFMTGVCVAAYLALLLLRPELTEPIHYPVIFAMVLAVIGFVVAYQVYRVRVLSRYYDQRRL